MIPNTNTLDEILLDISAMIELSPRDRRVAENRYRLLKQHLERGGSQLAPYLVDGASLIYAQGSIATSTTIVSGTEDDRFDVDAIVEIDVPPEWDNDQALDLLERSLQGFPNVKKVVRCTRCVQLQFAFMHLDVTIMDRSARIPIERAGEIFHSPDEGASSRVPANPWGFTSWFRTAVGVGQPSFQELMRHHRSISGRDLLPMIDEREQLIVAKADQVNLPPMIPNAIDAQQAVALKLLKRYLNLRYDDLPAKRPPSIYLCKRAGDVEYAPNGLGAQLYVLADSTAKIMRNHLRLGTRPNELNPSYRADRINDRWPADGASGFVHMEAFANELERLCERLHQMALAPLDEIVKIANELFGERIGQGLQKSLTARYDRRCEPGRLFAAPHSGSIATSAAIPSTSTYQEISRHNFHSMAVGHRNES